MAADELPDLPGLLRLENPEVGDGVVLPPAPYGLRDIAALHAQTIAAQCDPSAPLQVLGMSMGGMIAGWLATEFRALLPRETRFVLAVTSANTPAAPAIPDAVLAAWREARPGNLEDYERMMRPFFSKAFRERHPDVFAAYVRYRATGGNRQAPRAFLRQIAALRSFEGERIFAAVDPAEARFLAAADERAFNAAHVAELRRVAPRVPLTLLEGVGHMLNLERPDLFQVAPVNFAAD
jgi:pimeloyl-ACP methyl ester carboxylesterase